MRLTAALGSRTERACGAYLYTTAAALADGFLTGIGGNGANRGVKTPGGKVKQILFGLLMANADALSAQYALAPVVQNGAWAGLRAVPLGGAPNRPRRICSASSSWSRPQLG